MDFVRLNFAQGIPLWSLLNDTLIPYRSQPGFTISYYETKFVLFLAELENSVLPKG